MLTRFFFALFWIQTPLLLAGAEQPEYTFQPLPAIHGGHPKIEIRTTAEDPIVTVTVSELRDQTSHVIETYPLAGFKRLSRAELPEVERDTYTDVTIATERDPEAFRWRTLLRPPSKPLIEYQGRQEMLPADDFDQYWTRAKRELDRVELAPEITRVPERDSETGILFRVDLPTVEETTIACWYFVPRVALNDSGQAQEKCPAILIAPGYGAEEPPIDRTSSGIITLSVNPRNHGPSREFWKSPVEHSLYNIMNQERYYYKLAFLDCLRGAQFLFSRDEVDHERVGTEGGSQGGLFAIATAALEPRIAYVCTNVTAFSDFPDGFALVYRGNHQRLRDFIEDAPATQRPRLRKTLSYIDGANMITRVKAPIQINMGLKDLTCPFVCGIVMHNRVPSGVEKELNILPEARHEVTPEMRENNARWHATHLGIAPQ